MTQRREKVTLFGCGGWGERVARKLVERGDVDLTLVDDNQQRVMEVASKLGVSWSTDPDGYLMVTGTARSTIEPGSVIIATPPDTRVELVDKILNGYGLAPKRLRIEKPLAIEYHDGLKIIAACEAARTTVSVGFTLLHHWQYRLAFEYMKREQLRAVRVVGVRIGKRARHRAAAIVDLGSHTASIAAHLGCSASMTAQYSEIASGRSTQIHLENGSVIYIDEANGRTQLPLGAAYPEIDYVDPLSAELEAWLSDKHLGNRRVALGALLLVQDELDRMAVPA